MTLAYTIEKLTERQRAVIGRLNRQRDEYGAEVQDEWEDVATYPCVFQWWKSASGRSEAKEFATDDRTINFSGGSIMVAPGTDIRDQDRVTSIQDRHGNVEVEGPFRVVAVTPYPDHIDVALMKP